MQNGTGCAQVVSGKSREQLHRGRLLTFAAAFLVIGVAGCANLVPQRYQLAAEPLMAAPTVTIQVTYTVATGEAASNIATAIVAKINGDAGFRAAGVTASANGAIISFTLPQSFKLTSSFVPPTGHVTALIDDGPPVILTIAGNPQAEDTITIAGGASSAQKPSTPTPQKSGGPKPPAAVLGSTPPR